MAFCSTRGRLMPAPSSLTSMMTRPERCAAASRTEPSGGLPAAVRCSGLSSPWSTALRIMWVSGSASSSTTVLSTSVDSPSVRRRTSLPVASATSRTMRDMRWNSGPHRLGADRHDAFLDLARQALEFLEARCHLAVAHMARMQHALGQHGLVDDEFANEVDEPVHPVEVDADRRLHGGLGGLRRRAIAGFGLAACAGGGLAWRRCRAPPPAPSS